MFLCTGTFKDGITYPFTTDKISWSWANCFQFLPKWANLPGNFRFWVFPVNKLFTKVWTFVRDSFGINSGNFLDKGASFWSRTYLLTWEITALFAVLFCTIKSLSTIRFVAVRWWACLKGLFCRRRGAMVSTRKNYQCSFLGAFYFNNMWSELFAKKILITFLK